MSSGWSPCTRRRLATSSSAASLARRPAASASSPTISRMRPNPAPYSSTTRRISSSTRCQHGGLALARDLLEQPLDALTRSPDVAHGVPGCPHFPSGMFSIDGECIRSSTFPLPRYMCTPHGRQGSKLRTVRMMSMPLNLSGGFSSKIGRVLHRVLVRSRRCRTRRAGFRSTGWADTGDSWRSCRRGSPCGATARREPPR